MGERNAHKPRKFSKEEIHNMSLLPDFCYAEHPTWKTPLRILKGESGYYPPLYEGVDIDEINGQLGITYEQQEAMVHGSMFGWGVPAANPETWENDPKYQAKLKKLGRNNAKEMRAAIAKANGE